LATIITLEILRYRCDQLMIENQQYKDAEEHGQRTKFLAYDISLEVIYHYFGKEWVDEHVLTDENIVDTFLCRDQEFHIDRVVDFAELLLNCQDCLGFQDWVDKLKNDNRPDLEAMVNELRACKFKGITCRLRQETGNKRLDYDIDCILATDLSIPCEAKLKLEEDDIKQSTIEGRLKDARNQMPKKRPSIIFLQVPYLWVTDTKNREIVTKALESRFRNSRGTSMIVLHWDVKIIVEGSGATEDILAINHNFQEFFNNNPTFPIKDKFSQVNESHRWIGLYALIEDWYEFDEISTTFESGRYSENID